MNHIKQTTRDNIHTQKRRNVISEIHDREEEKTTTIQQLQKYRERIFMCRLIASAMFCSVFFCVFLFFPPHTHTSSPIQLHSFRLQSVYDSEEFFFLPPFRIYSCITFVGRCVWFSLLFLKNACTHLMVALLLLYALFLVFLPFDFLISIAVTAKTHCTYSNRDQLLLFVFV